MKKEIKRIKKELDLILSKDTNHLLHTEFAPKEIISLVNSINNHLTNLKNKESKLERKNTNFKKMIRNISHDLRTPLTSSLGYVNLMLDCDIPEKEKIKNLKIVEERLKRLSELIDSFFEFSKIISNDENITKEKINLVAILEKSISHHYEDFSNQNRVINLKTSHPKIIITSNEVMLKRIFDNLIRNSYKHSISNLDISVKAKDKIEITFANDLIYKNLDTDKIFDEFYTVDISRTKGNTGLGLAIVKEFTEQLNGQISASKKQNKLIIKIKFNK